MEFSLTDVLTQDIISAMDNQESVFVVDAQTSYLIEQTGSVKADDEYFYSLPEWKPADGFAMREAFVNILHNPLVRDELLNVMHSGRGVFKNFKIILKEYPEVDKRWHIFKNKYMSARISEWYNSLREVWGLEKLDYFSDSDEDLVHDDFIFSDYSSSENQEEVLFNTSAFLTDESDSLPEEIKKTLYEMWENQFKNYDSTSQIGFVCYSQAEDFAGCVTASVICEGREDTMVLTSFFVPENFRGLGIGTELIQMLIDKLKSAEKKWIILPQIFIPDFLEPLLIRTGFKKTSAGFIAESQKL